VCEIVPTRRGGEGRGKGPSVISTAFLIKPKKKLCVDYDDSQQLDYDTSREVFKVKNC